MRLEDAIGEVIDDPRVICPRVQVRLVAVDREKRTATITRLDHALVEEIPIELLIGDQP